MKKINIGVVTPSLPFFASSGGIGTAMLRLAEMFSVNGVDTTLYLASNFELKESEIKFWQKFYLKKGIKFELVTKKGINFFGYKSVHLPYLVYDYLKEKNHDVLYFNDMIGLSYYCTLARKQNIFFKNTAICIVGNGTTRWANSNNNIFEENPDDIVVDFIEKEAIKNCDQFISTGQCLVDWMKENNWVLPKHTSIIQNVWGYKKNNLNEKRAKSALSNNRNKSAIINEIVFVGRIEERKGWRTLYSALKVLNKYQRTKVTFFTPSAQIGFRQLTAEIKKTKINANIIVGATTDEIFKYLVKSNCLVVLPSTAEVCSLVAMECFENSIPFIASDIKSFKELLSKRSQKKYLFKMGDYKNLAKKLRHILKFGATPAPARITPTTNINAWLKTNKKLVRLAARAKKFSKHNKLNIAVGILFFNRGHMVEAAIRSVLSQTRRVDQVVILDNSSSKETKLLNEAISRFETKKIKVIRSNKSLNPAGARNYLSQNMSCDFILFLDDDNLLKKNAVELFEQAQVNTGADIITACWDRFVNSLNEQPRIRFLPSGFVVLPNLIENSIGDTTALIRKKTFIKNGGFASKKLEAYEDWEFFLRSCVSGAKLFVMPEAALWYRDHQRNRTKGYSQNKVFLEFINKSKKYIDKNTISAALRWKKSGWKTDSRAKTNTVNINFLNGRVFYSLKKPIWISRKKNTIVKYQDCVNFKNESQSCVLTGTVICYEPALLIIRAGSELISERLLVFGQNHFDIPIASISENISISILDSGENCFLQRLELRRF